MSESFLSLKSQFKYHIWRDASFDHCFSGALQKLGYGAEMCIQEVHWAISVELTLMEEWRELDWAEKHS